MKTQCPACNSLYPIAEEHLGRSAKCKNCGTRFVVREFDPLDAALAEPFDDSNDIEEIGQETPVSSPEPPSEPPEAPKKPGSRIAFFSLIGLLLTVIAVLAVLLWMKTEDIKVLRQEHKALLHQINQLQSREKSRKKQKANTGQTFDFRHARWGMSKNNVIASQGRLPDEDRPHAIEYQGSLIGKKVLITYGFEDGRLIRAQYTFTEKLADPGEYLVVYDGLKVILTKKYGRPAKENAQWRDKTYYDDQSQWGRALAEGQVDFLSQWETKRTTINAFLGQKDGEITCVIEYLGKILSPPGGDASDSSPMNIM